MQRRQNRKTTLLLAFSAVFALEGRAFAQDSMKVRPGFGYTIDFMTGPAAEALLPPGWAKQKALTKPPQS